jgi:hypothetical protein
MTASVCRFTIAMIFALSAIHSMRDWAVYTAQVTQYKILPVRLARIASWILPPVQLAIGIMLVITNTACMPGLALMALFTAAIAINVARGRTDIECGCGGATGQKLSWALVTRNIILCGLLAVGLTAPNTSWDAATLVTIIGATAFLVTLYFAAGQLLANAQALTPRRAA